MDADQLKELALIVKHETVEKNNSANRIGTLFENIIDYFNDSIPTTTLNYINEQLKQQTSGLRKGMSVVWSVDLGSIPKGYVLADGNNGVPINGITIPDYRKRFLVGYDPRTATTPVVANDITENYGAAGNTGGKSSVSLTANQNGPHDHDYDDGSRLEDGWSGDSGTNRLGPTKGKTGKSGLGEVHENRPPYYVVFWITKVSDDTTAEYNSAYGSYKATTSDNPVLSEAEWIASLKGIKGNDGQSGIYTSEVVEAPTTGNLVLKNWTVSYIGILTSSNVFSIILPDPENNKVNESGINCKIGASLPTITWPAGIQWRGGVAPTLAINTIFSAVFEQVYTGTGREIWANAL